VRSTTAVHASPDLTAAWCQADDHSELSCLIAASGGSIRWSQTGGVKPKTGGAIAPPAPNWSRGRKWTPSFWLYTPSLARCNNYCHCE